ncbi:MAG TPA: WYL domain-containing transcriptional regulator [Pirellulaceae bacterium]|nr:WYL domain-containing transcriptional regulator [Pirellulaceae bacterium]HMP68941.1 WYL domain-containing transcriptional regulator [Pirellulaceae bacterium]
MARNEQLIRQHKILQILERIRFGETIEEIRHDVIEELGLSKISSRTILRDLEALQAAGFDIQTIDVDRGKVYKLGPRSKAPAKIAASSTELISLFLGRQLLFPLAGTPFWQGIETFWQKIQDELPVGVVEHYERFKKTLRVLGVAAKNYEKHHGILGTIHRAIMEHRVLEIKYHSLENPGKVRYVEPYSVVLYNSSLYILAREKGDQAHPVRNWKLDRFEKAVALDEYFKVPSDLDLDRFIGQGAGIFLGEKRIEFKIWISREAAVWVREEPWHPDQSIKQLNDGAIELMVPAVDEREIIPKVLSFGPNAKILAPTQSKNAIKAMLAQMLAQY